MSNSITVKQRNVYGNDLIYPVSHEAKLFAKLTGKKTFSLDDLEAIEALGFRIEAQQQPCFVYNELLPH